MIETKAISPLKAQVTKLESQAQAVTIATKEEYAMAADLVSKLKSVGQEIRVAKETITRPLNEALRNARELFAPIEKQFESAEAIVKAKLLEYKRKADEEARAEEAKIASRVERGMMKIETAEKKLDAIERVDNTTQGKVGEVQVRKIKKVRIVDENALPREYLMPNEVAIRRDALGGKTIPGVEVWEDEIVAAR